MKKLIVPLAAAAGGAIALALRLWQNLTGFEADTGLPIPGAPAGIALVFWLAAAAAVLLLLVRWLPQEKGDGPAFPFPTENTGLMALVITGVFLMAASGALDLISGIAGISGLSIGESGTPPAATGITLSARGQFVMGTLALASAACLFPAAAACRRKDFPFRGAMLLVPPTCIVTRMVLVYRIDSVDPALDAYYVELLALTFLTLALYRLSSFAYRAGRTRRFALYASLAVVLCAATLADGHSLSGTLLYAGGGLSLLGFLLLRLTCPQSGTETPPDAGKAG